MDGTCCLCHYRTPSNQVLQHVCMQVLAIYCNLIIAMQEHCNTMYIAQPVLHTVMDHDVHRIYVLFSFVISFMYFRCVLWNDSGTCSIIVKSA